MGKVLKTREEFTQHMWKLYPQPIKQLPQREAMLKAYDFLTGIWDQQEKEREEIKKQIGEKLKKDFGYE